MKIRCIAIDDEPLALVKMRNYIARAPFLELVADFDNAIDAINFLRRESIDLIFLDIQMEELSGIQLLEVLKDPPMVILTTAYDEYALKGYEMDVLDYLLKPIDFARFQIAVDRAQQQHQLHQPKLEPSKNQATEEGTGQDFVLVRSEYKMIRIRLDEIYYIMGMKDYSRLYCADRRIMTMQTIGKMENALPHPRFFRIHKSYIIALDKLEAFGKNHVQIKGEEIPIGSMYKQAFLNYLEGFKQV
jgi:DNA-binding LytR/AlgR family response regulator